MQKGFTLIELMVTLVVLVVSLSVGVPSFVTWIKNNRIDTATRTIAGALQLARNEAVSQQSVISVSPGTVDNPGSWTNGAHIYTDTGSLGTPYNAGTDTLLKNIDVDLSGIIITDNDSNNVISFRGSGLLNEGGAERTITFCQSSGETDGTSVIINPAGRATINTVNNC